jgi:putative heme-binding domain-containing protein
LFNRSDSQQHAFTCEPFHNLVQHNIISDDGVSFGFHRDPAESEFDFFASRDRWCRPVMARTGPDGGLWIVDMYRYMIEHPEWLPESGKNELRPYFRLGQHHGRIYRVVPKGRDVSKWSTRFADLSTGELVATLESSNGWERDAAQRRLIRARDPASIELLQQMVRSSVHPLARLHAISTLDGMRALSVTTLETALADKHSGVRRHAVRLSDSRMVDIQKLNALVEDPDAKVRLQLAVALGSQADPYAAQILAELAVKSADDVYITANVMSSLHRENSAEVLSHYSSRLAHSEAVSKGQRDLQLQFFRQAAALADSKAIGEIIALTCTPLEHQLVAWQRLGLAELLDGLGDRGFSLDQLSAQHHRLIDLAIDQARTSDSDPSAIRLLLRQPQKYDSDIQQLADLLVPQSAIDVQIAASNRLSEMPDASIARLLLAGWKSYGPVLRSHLFHLLASRNDWSRMLLANVADGSVSVAEMSPSMRQTFLTTADKSLQAGWQDVFATKSSVDRSKVLGDFRSALQLPGDSDRGIKVFEKHCATCHRIGTLGHDVGPNLASITDRRPEALLSSILDPSAAVEARYLTYVLLTVDGRAVNGLLAAETASSVTFLSVDGKKTTVLRKEIENLRATGKSFMPDGLEKNLNAQQIADLIHLLRN